MYFKIILIALIAYLLILIAYPETRLWLKELIKKHPFLSGSLTCLVFVIITFLYFPLLFKSIAIEFWGIPTTVFQDGSVEVAQLVDLGPIGDIFGSLNSFISSIALCAVAFSTWLQVTSLKEARETNQKQLLLAEKSHQEQLKETKYSIFSNMFYELLNQKNQRYQNLVYKGPYVELHIDQVVNLINEKFDNYILHEWVDVSLLKIEDIQKAYMQTLREITREKDDLKGDKFSNLFLYFRCYTNLYDLINRSELEIEDKEFFKKLVKDSMTIGEQVTLFWIGAFDHDANQMLRNQVLDAFFEVRVMPFAVKFLDKSCFSHPDFLSNWNKFAK
jgi:uncharacterized membrane protein